MYQPKSGTPTDQTEFTALSSSSDIQKTFHFQNTTFIAMDHTAAQGVLAKPKRTPQFYGNISQVITEEHTWDSVHRVESSSSLCPALSALSPHPVISSSAQTDLVECPCRSHVLGFGNKTFHDSLLALNPRFLPPAAVLRGLETFTGEA